MDEIKIEKALETEIRNKERAELGKALAESEGKTEGKHILIILAVLIGVMFFSLGGFKAYEYFTGAEIINVDDLHQENLEGELDEKEGYLYNGFSFVYADGLWWTEMRKGEVLLKVPLHFGPKEVDGVGVEGGLNEDFNKEDEVYMAIDPEFGNKYYTLALSELNFNVLKGIERKPVAACSKNNSICEDREILNCNETKGKAVIELRYGGESKITLLGTCILISGEDYGLVKAADRLIWQWYGVMG